MNNSVVVSIITPCYNSEKYLRETLESVCAQTFQYWECIMVNDGSSDATLSIMEDFSRKDSRFISINKNNEGVSVARNIGASYANGKYLLPLDSDDLIDSTYLEKAVKHFEENPLTKLVYCKARFFGDLNKSWDLEEYSYESLLWNNCIFVSAIFRKEDFVKSGGFNPNMVYGFEDWDFMLSLLLPNDVVYRIPEELFFYRIRQSSRNATASQFRDDSLAQIVQNHKLLYETFYPNIIKWHNECSYFKNECTKNWKSPFYKTFRKLTNLYDSIMRKNWENE